MNTKNTIWRFAIILVLFSGVVFTQSKTETDSSIPTLLQVSNYAGSEMESVYIDMLANELRANIKSRGVVIVYCGKKCQFGEVNAHLRGLGLSFKGKGIDKELISTLNGGYKEKLTIEYWYVPEGACLIPIPTPTVAVEDVQFKGKYRNKYFKKYFKGEFVPYDCCGDPE